MRQICNITRNHFFPLNTHRQSKKNTVLPSVYALLTFALDCLICQTVVLQTPVQIHQLWPLTHRNRVLDIA